MKNDEQIWNSENLFTDFSPFQLSKHQQSFQYNQNIHAPVFIVQQTIPDTEIDENLVEITLPGQLISIIRQNGGQANEEFILEKIKPFFPYLRRINGNKYCGKLEKTVIGGLHSSEIFNFEKEIGVWTVREELAKKYETKLMEKIKKMERKLGKKGRKISKITDNEEKKENSIPKSIIF